MTNTNGASKRMAMRLVVGSMWAIAWALYTHIVLVYAAYSVDVSMWVAIMLFVGMLMGARSMYVTLYTEDVLYSRAQIRLIAVVGSIIGMGMALFFMIDALVVLFK
jgi:nitrate reductase gamma subunit